VTDFRFALERAPLVDISVPANEDFVARCREVAKSIGMEFDDFAREGMRRELGRLERRLVAQRGTQA
jgi:hypothetical protein